MKPWYVKIIDGGKLSPIDLSFSRRFSRCRRIGIELEMWTREFNLDSTLRESLIKKIKEHSTVLDTKYSWIRSDGIELQILFDITDPVLLYKQLDHVVKIILTHNLLPINGMHINVQNIKYKRNWIDNWIDNYVVNLAYDLIYDPKNKAAKRLEFEKFQGFTNRRELFIQLVMAAKAANYISKEDYNPLLIDNLKEEIKRICPSDFLQYDKMII